VSAAPYPPPHQEDSGALFCYRLSQTQGHSAAGRVWSIEKPNGIEIQTRNLPACRIVPQPTMLLCAIAVFTNIMFDTVHCPRHIDTDLHEVSGLGSTPIFM
jgi:hypothetical protein